MCDTDLAIAVWRTEMANSYSSRANPIGASKYLTEKISLAVL